MAPTADAFIAACEREVGYRETAVNRTKYAGMAKHANGYAWCHTFLAGMAAETGLDLPDGTPGDGLPDAVGDTAYTPTGANAWKRVGRWGTVPRRGAWAYVDFPGDGVDRISHVWLVKEVYTDGTQQTIEGNTSIGSAGDQREGLWVASRRRKSSLVVGYGYPEYAAAAPAPKPPHVIVRAGSPEHALVNQYPALFGLPVRAIPAGGVQATDQPGDVAFGISVWGAGTQIRGADRYETLRLAVEHAAKR